MIIVPKAFDFEKEYRGFTISLERKGLQLAATPYWLWIYVVMAGDKFVEAGTFPWSSILPNLSDEEAADIISRSYDGTSRIAIEILDN